MLSDMSRRLLIIGGGQSGLATARAARESGWDPVVLEAGQRPAGSWTSYYDSLTLFSPVEFSGFPGYAFPGRHDHYPRRDEVADFLAGYANWLGVDLRTSTRVVEVVAAGSGFEVRTEAGETHTAEAIVAASGSFGNPVIPAIPGTASFGGMALPVSDYRASRSFAGKRVVVLGAGNSAVQVGYELASVARVTLAVRRQVRLVPQIRGGRDLHFWLRHLGLDLLPPWILSRLFRGTLVFDTGRYRDALDRGAPDQRPMFRRFTADGVVWGDVREEKIDVVIFATGYRPWLPYLSSIGALSTTGLPLHRQGLSTTHAGLGYVGLEFQRSFSSNTLRGVHRDASFIVSALSDRVSSGRKLDHVKGR